MSKLTKLVRRPGPFFRDFFIKRYPLNFGGNIGSSASGTPADLFRVEFPIDVVYTWVNRGDEEWRRDYAEWKSRESELWSREDPTSENRFIDRGELRYSMRSLEAFAPWVNHVYIVTSGQRPEWLREPCAGVTVVPHDAIIPSEYLPTFNSHVIESFLHEIPDLTEQFIYLNDDVLLARPLEPAHFFTGSGASRISMSGKQIPEGAQSALDTPMDCASKNVRSLLERRYGKTIERQILHGSHALRRSTMRKCRDMIREAGADFYSARFRSRRDLNVATLMSHCVGYIDGHAVPATSSCMYFNIHSPKAAFCYKAMMDLKGTDACPDTMCVNDVVSDHDDGTEDLVEFLEAYLPDPHPAELL